MLMCGDFWQLPSVDGVYLADIPTEYIRAARKFEPAPTIAHGQALLWARDGHGLAGMTELHECERCDDEWLKEVQAEIRTGQLSENNHAFLHGKATVVPGSWCNGRPTCGNKTCAALAVAKCKAPQLGTKRPRLSRGCGRVADGHVVTACLASIAVLTRK